MVLTSQLNDSVKYTYLCTAGDLGWRGDGYSHSNVVDFTLSSKWQYVFQSDLLDTDRQHGCCRRRSELWREQLLVLHHQRLLEVGYACGMVEEQHSVTGDRPRSTKSRPV